MDCDYISARGGTPRNIGWGNAARFPKPFPIPDLLPVLSCKVEKRLGTNLMTIFGKTWIGHFRILPCLCFKTRLVRNLFVWKWVKHPVSFSCKSKVIFIRMVSHLDSLWNRGTRELGNGLLNTRFPAERLKRRIQQNTKNRKTWLSICWKWFS